jgi:uncharacterized membrane protein YheB (UPF0754 family)
VRFALAAQNSLVTPEEIQKQEKVDRDKAILMKKKVRDRIKELREKYLKKNQELQAKLKAAIDKAEKAYTE